MRFLNECHKKMWYGFVYLAKKYFYSFLKFLNYVHTRRHTHTSPSHAYNSHILLHTQEIFKIQFFSCRIYASTTLEVHFFYDTYVRHPH